MRRRPLRSARNEARAKHRAPRSSLQGRPDRSECVGSARSPIDASASRRAQRSRRRLRPRSRSTRRLPRRDGPSSIPIAIARWPSSPCATRASATSPTRSRRTAARRSACSHDLRDAKSVGVIAESPELGLTEIARPVGVVAADHAVDQSRGDARQQHHQCAEGPQRHHSRAVAQGSLDRRAAARVHPRRARSHRRAARPRPATARPGDARGAPTS